MSDDAPPTLEEILPFFYRRHPWHGVPLGPEAPAKVTAFVEIVEKPGTGN